MIKMNEEELYKLAISDVSTYPLLNEILATRDNRFPNEKVDYCINVNGYISLDVLNKYVNTIQENEDLKEKVILLKASEPMLEFAKETYKNNWNELKEFVEKHIKRWEKEEQEWIKLGFMKVGGEANNKIIFKMVQNKMQELDGNNESSKSK